MTSPNFADNANWKLIYDNFIRAVVISSSPLEYNPIPATDLSFSLKYRFLRVAVNNQNAKATWRFGGNLDLLVDDVGGAEVSRKSLSVNKAVVIAVPDYLERYRVRVSFPYWFDEVSLQVDGYEGSAKPIKINCGGGAVGDWIADTYFSGGDTYVYSSLGLPDPNPPSGVADPVFGEERSGDNFSYSIPNLSGSYTLKLYFNESGQNSSGSRVFSVAANSQTILDNFDIFSQIGKDKVIVKQFNLNLNGSLTLNFVGVVDNAQINAIELQPV
jgi:hypothetical protein